MIKTILIVDDSEGDQFYHEIIMTTHNENINIIKAYDGKEALELVEKMEQAGEALPDLILLDINMPRMNGHEFLDAYSQDNQREIPVVVMLTSSDQEQDKDRALQYNCVKDYLVKPMTVEKMAKLDQLIKDM